MHLRAFALIALFAGALVLVPSAPADARSSDRTRDSVDATRGERDSRERLPRERRERPDRNRDTDPEPTPTPEPEPDPDPTDATAPSVPSGVQVTAPACDRIEVTWNASTDTGGSGLRGYDVYRDGNFYTRVLAPLRALSDGNLTESTAHSYRIAAFDGAGNRSARSSSKSATTPSCAPDPLPPEPGVGQLSGLGRIVDTALDSAGRAAVVVSSDLGLTYVDISDAARPRSAGRVNLPYMESAVATDGDYAYVSQVIVGPPHRGELSVVDLRSGSPVQVGRVGFPDGPTRGNIAVRGNVVYLTTSNDLYLFDVSNPQSPSLLSTLPIAPPHDMAVAGGKVLLQSGDALRVVDVNDPRNPRDLGAAPYYGGNDAFDFVGGVQYRIDSASLWIYASSNPLSASLIVRFRGLSPSPQDVAVTGGVAVIGTSDGMLLIDVADPSRPEVIDEVATTSEARRVKAGGGFVLASDSLGTLVVMSQVE